MLSIREKMTSQLLQALLGNNFWTYRVEVPIEERCHPVPLRYPEEIVPVYGLPQQRPDLRGPCDVHAGPGTAEKQLDFRAHGGGSCGLSINHQ